MAKVGCISQYLIGSLGPDERFGILVGDVKVMVDSRFKFEGAPVDAATQLLFSKQCESSLHQIEP